ncbi:MAG TPA: ABC transporter permease [Vicinamibacterales bacterium]|nr:ABC transporter permease [Vicinamibacterales bacterium]
MTRRRDPDDDLKREIQTHLDLEAEEQRVAGLPARDARDAAIRAFGSPTRVREIAREARRWIALDHFVQDVRFAIRQMRRAPGVAFTAILTLALGIGANTAIFSVISGFFRPLPVANPDQLVVIASMKPDDQTGLRYEFSFPALQDYRRATADVFSEIMADGVKFSGITIAGKTTTFVHQNVSANFFTGLGLRPAAGRLFDPAEGERVGLETIVVLGHSFWLRRFGGDPAVIGTLVRIDGEPARIVGVAPEGFRGVFEGADMEGYVPIGTGLGRVPGQQYVTDRAVRRLRMLARLRPGVSIATAQAAVDVVAGRLAAAYPDTEGNTTAKIFPETLARPIPLEKWSELVPYVRGVLLGLASIVLLIACMNVANLLLVRAMARQREMAVRAALGSGRRRLVRMLLVESLLMTTAGTTLGLCVGAVASALLVRSVDIGFDAPLHLDFTFDWRVFTYAAFVALGTTLVVGVLPARRASRAEITDLLHEGGRSGTAGATRSRALSSLVIAQIAGCAALLVVAGLFLRTLQNARQVDLGFDPTGIVTARLDPSNIGRTPEQSNTFYLELERRIREWPGVEYVTSAFSRPLGLYFGGYVVFPTTEPIRNGKKIWSSGVNTVTPDYFAALRIPIVRGRAFTWDDDQNSRRVAITNEAMAERFWPGQDPIGKTISIPESSKEPLVVVGVARDAKYAAVFEPRMSYCYLPQLQDSSRLRTVYIRSSRSFEDIGAAFEREVHALEPDLPIRDLGTLSHLIATNLGFVVFQVGAIQAAATGLLGLTLAIIGIYGLISYRTAQRSREIGIRLALGAQARDVRTLVLQQGGRLAITGIAVGLAIAIVFGLALSRFLVFVSTIDPITFGAVTVLLAAAALLACDIPARRATRIDPIVVLRHE